MDRHQKKERPGQVFQNPVNVHGWIVRELPDCADNLFRIFIRIIDHNCTVERRLRLHSKATNKTGRSLKPPLFLLEGSKRIPVVFNVFEACLDRTYQNG